MVVWFPVNKKSTDQILRWVGLPSFDRARLQRAADCFGCVATRKRLRGRGVPDFLHERHSFKQLFVLFAGLSCRPAQTSDHRARWR